MLTDIELFLKNYIFLLIGMSLLKSNDIIVEKILKQ
jgi:hypothetical protein